MPSAVRQMGNTAKRNRRRERATMNSGASSFKNVRFCVWASEFYLQTLYRSEAQVAIPRCEPNGAFWSVKGSIPTGVALRFTKVKAGAPCRGWRWLRTSLLTSQVSERGGWRRRSSTGHRALRQSSFSVTVSLLSCQPALRLLPGLMGSENFEFYFPF